MPRAAAILVLVSLLLTAPAAHASAQDDAGLGRDAPDRSSDAVDLLSGTYTAQVVYSDGDKEDWFRVSLPIDGKIRVTFRPIAGALYGGLYDDRGFLVTNAFTEGPETVLESGIVTHYRLGFGNQAGRGAAIYEFTITILVPQDDANSGGDAADTLPGAPIIAGRHYGGRLAQLAGDVADWYHFAPPSCGGVVLGVATYGTPFQATIHDEQGAILRTGYTSEPALILTVATDGPFFISFTGAPAGADVWYTFGVLNGPRQDDAGSGCDAPGTFDESISLEPGAYEGELPYDHADSQDWYRFDVPECSIVQIQLNATDGTVGADFYTDEGEHKFAMRSIGVTDASLVHTGPFRLGIGDPGSAGSASYRVSVRVIQSGDEHGCVAPVEFEVYTPVGIL